MTDQELIISALRQVGLIIAEHLNYPALVTLMKLSLD